MVQVNDCVEWEDRDVPFGEVRERVILECGCRARMILVGHMSVRYPLECGVCEERFLVSRIRRRLVTGA